MFSFLSNDTTSSSKEEKDEPIGTLSTIASNPNLRFAQPKKERYHPYPNPPPSTVNFSSVGRVSNIDVYGADQRSSVAPFSVNWILKETMLRLHVVTSPTYAFLSIVASNLPEGLTAENLISGTHPHDFREFAGKPPATAANIRTIQELINWMLTSEETSRLLTKETLKAFIKEMKKSAPSGPEPEAQIQALQTFESELEKALPSAQQLTQSLELNSGVLQRELAWRELPEHLGFIIMKSNVYGAILNAHANIKSFAGKPHFKLRDLMFGNKIMAHFGTYVASLMRTSIGISGSVATGMKGHYPKKQTMYSNEAIRAVRIIPTKAIQFFKLVDYNAQGELEYFGKGSVRWSGHLSEGGSSQRPFEHLYQIDRSIGH